ncbi:hypothetical protein [Paraburkholderia heleia]|uniref:hypothetical protein n=1 Tax=Paraburkholderia heleia TaxID=634127 RepID=UPI002AB76F2A|nr:hypothetical protein [Paraburkholderia heleia]
MTDRRASIRPIGINGYEAVAEFDPVTGIYRGEFPGLNGRPDFHATDEAQVVVEGRRSLAIYLESCTSRITTGVGA